MAAGDRIRKAAPPAEPFKKSDGRVSFPHRMSLDLTDEQYEWLKEMAWQNRTTASGLLRTVLGRLAEKPQLLKQITGR